MTREVAIRQLQSLRDHCQSMMRDEYEDGIWVQDIEALDLALSALRPVSREQVERMRAKWISVHDTSGRDWSKCGSCQAELDGLEDAYNFCPSCGAPMTGEAVQMVMERMEALHETVE